MNEFMPTLIESRISNNVLNPGECLWVTLYWQSTGNTAEKDYRFFLDAELGHQRRIENKRCYFRTHADALPQTTRWSKYDVVAVTFRWEIITNWSGTFHLNIGILDENGTPLPFTGEKGETTLSQYIGNIDVGWNLGRPWVLENTMPMEKQYNAALPVSKRETIEGISLHDGITVLLDNQSPSILSISDEKKIYKNIDGVPYATLWKPAKGIMCADGEVDCKAVYTLAQKTDTYADYHAVVFVGSEKAAEYNIFFMLEDRILSVGLENIEEYSGWELLSLKFNSLFEMTEGFLLDFYGSGRLVSIESATPAFFEKKYDVRNAAVLYDESGLVIVESAHIDSLLTTGVVNVNGVNRGIIGAGIVAKIPATKGFPSIPVKEPPVLTIELPRLSQTPDWQTAAQLLRRGVKPNYARELYRNCHFYKQIATWGPMPDEKYRRDEYATTQNLFRTVPFDEILDNVRGFYEQTDGARQTIYIAGWLEGGFDNTNPLPKGAEARCGGTQKLRDCLLESRQYNAFTGLHDNFDDVAGPFVDDCPYVSIDERGERWRGWIWAAGLSYIMGLKKYVDSGAMCERVENMTKLFPLADTYHLDVLTAEVCRYDFDPTHPASAQDSFNAKMQIVEEFNRKGIDVTSEMLAHPAVGKIGFALHNRLDTNGVFIPGDRFVPLVQMIYHGYIGYCCPCGTHEEILWGLLLGGQTFIETDTAGEYSISRFYIQGIPAMLLYNYKMTDFHFNGEKAYAQYEENCFVEADFTAKQYTVTIDGIVVGRNFTTFTRGNTPDCYLAYSFDGGKIGYPLPEIFRGKALEAICLTVSGEGDEIDCLSVESDVLELDLPAMTPVKIRVRHQ